MFNYKYLQYSTSLFFIRFVSNFFKLGSALTQHQAVTSVAFGRYFGSRFTHPRKIPSGTFHPGIFPQGMFPPNKTECFFGFQLCCFGWQHASLALGLRTLVGTGSRQRHISQSQASLGGMFRGETTGVESSGGNFPGGNLPVTYIYPSHLRNLDCLCVMSYSTQKITILEYNNMGHIIIISGVKCIIVHKIHVLCTCIMHNISHYIPHFSV